MTEEHQGRARVPGGAADGAAAPAGGAGPADSVGAPAGGTTAPQGGTPAEVSGPPGTSRPRSAQPDRDAGPPEGRGPARVHPAGLAEAADVLAGAAGEQHTVLFEGAGTALEWGAPVGRTDLVLETSGLDRMLSHAPEDWTVGVEAGMPLGRLQELLAPSGQWLPVDAPSAAEGATLGGLLASGDAGPSRLKYGGLADLVIGATLVLADGTVARTGGDVIKNVAGYDLAKMIAGSLGAFGLAVRLNLRVHPLPEAVATLAVPAARAEDALAAARAVLRSPLEPVAVEWDGQRLLIRFQGTAESVAERGRLAVGVPELAAGTVLDADAESTAWQRLSRLMRGADGETVLRAGTRPARLPALVRRLRELTEGGPVEAELVSGVAQGLHTVVLRGGKAADHAAVLTAWRECVHEAGGSVTLRRRREGVDAHAPAWGPAPASVGVLRALKRQFDPDDLCAPGRFAPWF